MTHQTLEEISDEQWDYTFATSILLPVVKAALPHVRRGSSINSSSSSSVNSNMPSHTLAAYAATKGRDRELRRQPRGDAR
jgi:NAD(P)-dependent dehydrogenase (short-subunit alcohol dehydrogenase family)